MLKRVCVGGGVGTRRELRIYCVEVGSGKGGWGVRERGRGEGGREIEEGKNGETHFC